MKVLARLVFVSCLALFVSFASSETRAQRRHRPAATALVRRAARPPAYLNRLRGINHRRFESVGNDYLPTVSAVYNHMLDEIGAWRPHLARCAGYHAQFAEAARIFQVPVAFVAGIALHESHCVATASDWAGGRGLMQLTYTSRRWHVRPLERLLRRPLHWRRTRLHQTDPVDHLLVGLMHWVLPERLLRFQNRRGFGLLGYNMDVRTIRSRLRVLRRGLRRPPTFAEFAMTLPCIGGPRGRCPQEYVARVLAASYLYQQHMGNQLLVRVQEDPSQTTRRPLMPVDLPGFDPALDRSFPTTLTPR